MQEVNKLVKKAHGVVEGFERMGAGLQNGFSDMAGFVGGIKSVFKILEIFKKEIILSQMSHQSPEHHNRSHFWPGFTLGAVLGVAGVYLLEPKKVGTIFKKRLS